MRSRRRSTWIRLTGQVARVLVLGYPEWLRVKVGDEMVDALERRLVERRVSQGSSTAWMLAGRELVILIGAGINARFAPRHRQRHAQHRWFAELSGDARDVLRGLRRDPNTALLSAVLLGIGIGVATATYQVLDDSLWDPVPFPAPDELVHVWADRSWQDRPRGLVADVQLSELRREEGAFEGLSALWMVSGRVLGGSKPVHTDVARVSANFFDVLEVTPTLGRAFRPGEDRPGAPWVALLSHDYWMREFGGATDVIGRRLVIGWPEMEVIGVLPPDFQFEIPPELGDHGPPDLWVPWWHQDQPFGRATGGILAVVGRLADGVSISDARSVLESLARREDVEHYGGRGFRWSVESLRDAWVGDAVSTLRVMGWLAVVVLIVTIASASTMLLARSMRRARDFGVRSSLGATPRRIARLQWMEGAVVMLAGGVIGLVIAPTGLSVLGDRAPEGVMISGALSGQTLLLGMIVALLAGLTANLAPSFYVSGEGWRHGLASSTTGRLRTTRRSRALGGSIVVQVALSVFLLVGTGLLLHTLRALSDVELGFDPDRRLVFSMFLMNDYPTLEDRVAFHNALRTRLATLANVRSVSGTSALPLSDATLQIPVAVVQLDAVDPDDFPMTQGFSVLQADRLDGVEGEGWALADGSVVQLGYFGAAGISMRAGKDFGPHHDAKADRVVVIDQVLAERFFPDVSHAVGKELWLVGAWREVIGVVGHARQAGLRDATRPQVYFPYAQVNSGRVQMIVETDGKISGLESAIRAEVAELNPLVPITNVQSFTDIVRAANGRERFVTLLLGVFSGVSVLLVALSLYGVLSMAVRRRTAEIAVRLIVGAGRVHVAWLVVAQGLWWAGLGLALGLVGAVGLGQAADDILFAVTPTDPLTLVGAAVLVFAIALVGSGIPVVRAMSVEPARVLSTD